MSRVLVDSNVILDLFLNDPAWADWSERMLGEYAAVSELCINPIIYAEVSIAFQRIEEVEAALNGANLRLLEIPREALFLAGKAFLAYRRRGGTRSAPLPDFFIGAQAAVLGLELITRDVARYAAYFPTVNLITP